MLKAVSLFCGCGGTDIGLLGGFDYLGKHYESNDVEIVYANDIDRKIIDLYNCNFHHKAVLGDVRFIDEKSIPDHDILTGGFPCQSFSIVAQNPKRLGYKDEKGRLFFEMIRILKHKQPTVFIAENVNGILSANDKQAFPLILENFRRAGYNISYKVINASDFGVPQNRLRVFIVGIKESLNLEFNFPDSLFPKNDKVPLSSVLIDESYVAEKYYFSNKAIQGLLKSNIYMNKGRIQSLDKPCNTVGAHLAKVSINSTDPVLCIDGKYRRFTPKEVAKIQSFPDTFNLCCSDSIAYKALGNAIPPVLFWHLMKAIKQQIFPN